MAEDHSLLGTSGLVLGIRRILKGIKANSVLQIVLGILWIFFGGFVLWILDIIFILINDYPFWFK